MTEPPQPSEADLRYRERGAAWTALLWGPLFALLGFLAELATGGPLHTIAWVLVGLGLAAMTAPWVYARKRFLSVRLTRETLWQGREPLEVRRIAEVTDVGAPAGARVLGGGWSVPRKFDEVPIKLDDGTVVLAWAKDGEALRTALRGVLES
ncbi:hypothetical protein [Amycolatopsis anabasis]|uniref:hypothetical protein n=1 Tax=Amycolatopsis anabasis TaxID=1840409 RepID=UPI001FE9CB6B|nr:hypothetical protein [Amycolatopsis anabasis]